MGFSGRRKNKLERKQHKKANYLALRILLVTTLLLLLVSFASKFNPVSEAAPARQLEEKAQLQRVIITDNKEANSRSRSNFSVRSIYSVYLGVVWDSLDGAHTQRVEFYCPDGHLYQTLCVPFTTCRLPQMKRKVQWSPHPVELRLAHRQGSSSLVWAELPVAGTWAMRLPGRWKAKIYLDGEESCYRQVHFVLRP